MGNLQDALISLLPRVVELVQGRDIPIIAAGGIVDERGYVASLALGAQGIAMGTRYVTSLVVGFHYTLFCLMGVWYLVYRWKDNGGSSFVIILFYL